MSNFPCIGNGLKRCLDGALRSGPRVKRLMTCTCYSAPFIQASESIDQRFGRSFTL